MAIYVTDKPFPEQLPPLKNLYGFLDQHAQKIEGLLQFPPNTTSKFFAVWKQVTGTELMQLIGGSSYENPPEEELAAGVMVPSAVRAAFELISANMTVEEKRKQVEVSVKQKKLESEWFFQTSKALMRMLDSALTRVGDGVIIGLFE